MGSVLGGVESNPETSGKMRVRATMSTSGGDLGGRRHTRDNIRRVLGVLRSPFGVQAGRQRPQEGWGGTHTAHRRSWEVPEVSWRGPLRRSIFFLSGVKLSMAQRHIAVFILWSFCEAVVGDLIFVLFIVFWKRSPWQNSDLNMALESWFL